MCVGNYRAELAHMIRDAALVFDQLGSLALVVLLLSCGQPFERVGCEVLARLTRDGVTVEHVPIASGDGHSRLPTPLTEASRRRAKHRPRVASAGAEPTTAGQQVRACPCSRVGRRGGPREVGAHHRDRRASLEDSRLDKVAARRRAPQHGDQASVPMGPPSSACIRPPQA